MYIRTDWTGCADTLNVLCDYNRLTPTCTIIECHFPFPTVMKTCVGGVKVANVQFRLFHAPPAPSAPVLLGPLSSLSLVFSLFSLCRFSS
jgi:hypothetical protein